MWKLGGYPGGWPVVAFTSLAKNLCKTRDGGSDRENDSIDDEAQRGGNCGYLVGSQPYPKYSNRKPGYFRFSDCSWVLLQSGTQSGYLTGQ
jgi:hypothetical protein